VQVPDEDGGLAVVDVPGRGQQGERSGSGQLPQVVHGRLPLGLGELGLVAAAELVELARSCPYQRRSSVDGATTFAHSSILAVALASPRGQMRSTSTRVPSAGDGSS
jgi:hypothetical protein